MSLPSPLRSHFPSAPDSGGETGVRRRDVFFLSVIDLEQQIRDRNAVLDGSILSLADTGERYVVRDAVRVLGPVQGTDVFGMTARIVPIAELLAMGATLSAHTMRIGRMQYELQSGLLVQLIPSG
ncbi:MAG: hypothetical protein MUF54_02575 [Polyangiaceae bacterium]|nr:hypothetical protein [Polyangiaceae bacterium]